MECKQDGDSIIYNDGGNLSVGCWIVYSTAVLGHLLVSKLFTVKISLSLLRNCSLDDVKSSARNAWTNIGVTTSLVLTTVVGALIEGHEISPQGLCMDPAQLLATQQIFVSLCLACLFANVNCIIYCVLNLFYWDSLKEKDAIAFLKQNPEVLGETVIYMVESYIFFLAVIATWLYGTYGRTLATGMYISFTSALIGNLAGVWVNLARFRPQKPPDQDCGGCCQRRRSKDFNEWLQVLEAVESSAKAIKDDRDEQPAQPAEPVEVGEAAEVNMVNAVNAVNEGLSAGSHEEVRM